MSNKTKKEFKEYFETIVLPELKNTKMLIKQPTSGVYRLTYKLNTIEYYPSSGKYFHITKQVRGQLKEGTFEELIKKFTN